MHGTFRTSIVVPAAFALFGCATSTAPPSIETKALRLTIDQEDEHAWRETISIRHGDEWIPALQTNGSPTRMLAEPRDALDRPDITVFDMDDPEAGNWKLVSGKLAGPMIRPKPLRHGQRGRGVIDTHLRPDGWYQDGTGILESVPFEATRRYLTMRVAGGGERHRCRVVVLSEDGKEIGSLSGDETPAGGYWIAGAYTFATLSLDLSVHQGKTLTLRVEDLGDAYWDHISLDEVVLTDRDPKEVPIPREPVAVTVQNVATFEDSDEKRAIRVTAASPLGQIVRELRTTEEADVLSVRVVFEPWQDMYLAALEDRLSFAPARRDTDGRDDTKQGPLDFVWSPLIKEKQDFISADWAWKSPVIMFQQGGVFAALVPQVDRLDWDRLNQYPLALDLNVTEEDRPWLSYGVASSRPTGHSYSVRHAESIPVSAGSPIEFSYRIVASEQPPRLGYRRIVSALWDWFGHDAFLETLDLQRNFRRQDLWLFDQWRSDAWGRYADEIWREYNLGGKNVGTLVSRRRLDSDPQDDAWFNSWFQTLRTAYGMHVYGTREKDTKATRRAIRILELALLAPRKGGLFPSIATFEDNKPNKVTWVRDNAWAGFKEDYHVFDSSWTGYWMLRWLELAPSKHEAVLQFCRPYADFLLANQRDGGCIPSWYGEDLTPRAEYRDFNAETAGSALFLSQLYAATGHEPYLSAARQAMDFVEREVLPRHRWFDYETFKSCARKPFDFYDPYTAQFPQNNMSTFQAAKAYLRLYQITQEARYLDLGEKVLDYALLTQQVWNHPRFSPKTIGGFTTQNTDAEWSDARQCYGATLLLDYYNTNGRLEYLERAVAAARSTFAVAPWENWAHTGYSDSPGAMSGFHWGTGSAMASVEMMTAQFGDAYIDLERAHAVGFNACTIQDLKADDDQIAFALELAEAWDAGKKLRIRFAGADAEQYRVVINGQTIGSFPGHTLSDHGIQIEVSELR